MSPAFVVTIPAIAALAAREIVEIDDLQWEERRDKIRDLIERELIYIAQFTADIAIRAVPPGPCKETLEAVFKEPTDGTR